MNIKPSHITLNGQQIEISDLLNNIQPDTEPMEQLVAFLKEWYSKELFIKVQTSGSTGKPKTIQLNKTFVAESAKRTLKYFQLKENDRVLHCLPVRYIAGKLMIIRALLGKLNLFMVEPSSNFSFLKKSAFRFAAMVPNQVNKLFDVKSGHWNIDQLLIGGDAISSHLEEKLRHVKTACYSSYGMTETATHIAIRKLNGHDSEPYYHCLENISVQLSHENCLQIFIEEHELSPLKTNDIAELKNRQTFRILGRSDNVIISGGAKYSPEAIEKKLEASIELPFMISYLPHKKLGKQLVLLVEAPQSAELQSRLERACKNKLDKFEFPRQILFTEQLPRTDNGKLIRK